MASVLARHRSRANGSLRFFFVFEERFSPRQGFLFEIILYEEQRMFRLVDIKSQVATGKYVGSVWYLGVGRISFD